MPATHYIDNNSKLIITTWEGDAVDIELIDTITKYQEDVQINPEYIEYNEIVNFIKVASLKVTPKGIASIGKIAGKTDQYKQSGKVALIVNSGLAFNLARMYASYRNSNQTSNKEIRIFQNEKEALEWAGDIELPLKEISNP